MRIGNNYNLYNRPSFGAFRITSPAKKRVKELSDKIPFADNWRLSVDIQKAKNKFDKFKKDDLALYIKNGKLSASYFMRDGEIKPYASTTLEVEDGEHVNRFARKLRQYTEYAEFFDDSVAFLKKPESQREFV